MDIPTRRDYQCISYRNKQKEKKGKETTATMVLEAFGSSALSGGGILTRKHSETHFTTIKYYENLYVALIT